jgi:hypothetical protein
MPSILDLIKSQLDDDAVGNLSRSIGAEEGETRSAMSAALPALIGALNKNSNDAQGASGLAQALERDHDGSLLENLSGHFAGQSGGKQADGAGILGHLLGSRRESVQRSLASNSGIQSGSMGKMMEMLAPVVMGALGKQKRQGGLDASGLSDLLTRERQEVEARQPAAGGLMSKLFDQDGDGDLDLGDALKGLGRLF